MADTGEDREIKQRVKTNEAEAIRESKKLTKMTKQRAAKRGSPRLKRSNRSRSRS